MICPKCGFEQPESPECMRCGVVVGRYKGPVAPVAAQAAAFAPPGSGHETVRVSRPAPPTPAIPAAAESIFKEKPSFKEPEPELPADLGTVYGGPPPPPPPPSGGTVYSGPAPGTPAAMAAVGRSGITPVFSVTQKLRTGEILSESFAVYFKNIIPFVLLTAVAFSPVYFLLAAFSRQYAETHPVAALEASGLVGLATFLFCLPISTAGITYGVFQQMSGRDTSLGTCLSVGFSSLLRVLAVAILQILLVMGAVILTVIPIAFLIGMVASGGTRSSAACSIMLIPLLLLCYVPALMLWLKYFVAIPAAVEERPGTMESLRRSAFLTSGQRWPIFGALLVLGILYFGLLLTARLVPVAGPVVETLGGLLMLGLSATVSAVIYYRLRSFHESIDVDQIASVFA
jgi:hypothetical protein